MNIIWAIYNYHIVHIGLVQKMARASMLWPIKTYKESKIMISVEINMLTRYKCLQRWKIILFHRN